MGISRTTIREWFEEGCEDGATHMIVVCDTFSHEDYPSYIFPGEDVRRKIDYYNHASMQTVMEVYSMSVDKEMQINEHRAFHCETVSPSPFTSSFTSGIGLVLKHKEENRG